MNKELERVSQELTDAIAALNAQSDADTERDAIRYWWLRNGDKRKGVMSFDGISLKSGDALDAVIDAAILGEDWTMTNKTPDGRSTLADVIIYQLKGY